MFDMERTVPIFAINYHIADGLTPYEHVKVLDCPPCACPPSLLNVNGGGGLLEILNVPKESLMCAAFRAGLKITDGQCAEIIVMVPVPYEGRLTKLKKVDKCWLIINHLFPTESEEKKQIMVDKMCGKGHIPDILKSECPESVVDAVCTMDGDDFPYFKQVLKTALNMKAKADKQTEALAAELLPDRKTAVVADVAAGSGGAAGSAGPVPPIPPPEGPPDGDMVAMEGSANKWKSSTPREFQGLLPGKHSLAYVYLHCKPTTYIAIYQSRLDGPQIRGWGWGCKQFPSVSGNGKRQNNRSL